MSLSPGLNDVWEIADGIVAMSERDLHRIEILSKVIAGRMTTVSAAGVLDLSERQVRRLLQRIRTDGAASIRHKAIGRPSNNRIRDGVRDYAVTLVGEHYADFGSTLATEKLAERDGLLDRALAARLTVELEVGPRGEPPQADRAQEPVEDLGGGVADEGDEHHPAAQQR